MDNKSRVLLSNKNQRFIMLSDGETGDIVGPVYEHETQRASKLCIDKQAMELYFLDVSTRPLNIQVLQSALLIFFFNFTLN